MDYPVIGSIGMFNNKKPDKIENAVNNCKSPMTVSLQEILYLIHNNSSLNYEMFQNCYIIHQYSGEEIFCKSFFLNIFLAESDYKIKGIRL